MRIAIVQSTVVENKLENIVNAIEKIGEAARSGADLVILPEMFCCPYQTSNFPAYAEKEGGEHASMMAQAAKENGIYLVAGSMPEMDEAARVYNTSYAFDRQGQLIGKHRKMHLFDIAIEGGQHFKESDTLTAGDQVTVFDTEFGKIGLMICYDIRFPELSRLMVDRGARVIVVPAAFNMTTGPAHWEILFRTRALDNQVFMIGAAPARQTDAGYVSYANSIMVSPWGDILSRLGDKAGMAIDDLDLASVDKIRRQLPLLAHRRLDLYELKTIR